MQEGFIKYGKSKVHYIRFGKGEKLLIALHGFSERANSFNALQESLSSVYIVYALDLPFHGQTEWSKETYNQEDISAVFKLILEKENQSQLDLMGYSLGGRIVQKLLFEWKEQIDKVYLIAPDGLKTKGMFNAHLTPVWIRYFLKRLVKNPVWFINLSTRLNKWSLLDRFSSKFVLYHLKTKENRDRLFNTWISLDQFVLYPHKLKKFLAEHPIPVELYYGTKDKIIPAESGKQLSEGLSHVRLNLLEDGHLLLNEKLNEMLKRQLQEKQNPT